MVSFAEMLGNSKEIIREVLTFNLPPPRIKVGREKTWESLDE